MGKMNSSRFFVTCLVLLFHHLETATKIETVAAAALLITPTATTNGAGRRRRRRGGGGRCHEKMKIVPAATSLSSPSSTRLADVLGISSISRRSNKKSLACYHKLNKRFTSSSSSTLLSLSSNNGNSNGEESPPKSSSLRERGIYARPSAAIERGSGFFIPGLEGSRIRLLFGILALVLVVANHFFFLDDVGEVIDNNSRVGMVIAELISTFYGAVLILQGTIDFGVENSSTSSSNAATRGELMGSESKNGESVDSADGDDLRGKGGFYSSITNGKLFGEEENEDGLTFEDRMQRISRALIAYTPATEVRFVSEDFGILYSLGISKGKRTALEKTTTTTTTTTTVKAEDVSKDHKQLIQLCLDAVSSSRGGSRVALPPNHPSSKLLPIEATRCILVQKVNDHRNSRACIMVGSDKLLPSFTKNDLRWLGQLAQYNNLLATQQHHHHS